MFIMVNLFAGKMLCRLGVRIKYAAVSGKSRRQLKTIISLFQCYFVREPMG